MMIRVKFPKTLKSRIILYFLIITIVPSVTISLIYFRNSRLALEKNIIETSVRNLDYTMTIIEKQLKNAEHLSDWIFINKKLDKILVRSYSGQYDSDINDFLELVEYQLKHNASIGTHIYSLLIRGNNGLDLRAGQPEGTHIALDELEQREWFQQGVTRWEKFWYGVVENPSSIKFEEYIIPLTRPIIHSHLYREIGWHMIGFRTSLIAEIFSSFEIRPDETLLVIDSRGFCVYHNDPRYIGRDVTKLEYIQKIFGGAGGGHFSSRINGKDRYVVYSRSAITGWSIVRVLSSVELNRQKRVLLNITLIIFLSSVVFTSFLTVYLSINLTYPLTKLLQRTKAIALGAFDRDPSIEGEDELGVLGHGVNEMAENIRSLLERVIEDEQEKRRLELEVLQKQVNPHFLYNTLNSLKVMATIQKADGIREMVTALGRLLMNLSKNTAEKITLEEEISLLNDYIYIENIRHKGKIKLDYHLDDKDSLRCKIIKFTLQPIVENAIFHGIEPKKDAGRILITISRKDDRLVIDIEDDGVGMTPGQIEKILANPPTDKIRGMSKIGVKNVDERIKLVYGPKYGLTIESVVGEYTKVSLIIPWEV